MKKREIVFDRVSIGLMVMLFSCILALLPVSAKAAYFSDDFESGLSGKWLVSGQDWATTDLAYRSPNHCVSDSPDGNYPAYADCSMTLLNSIDLSSSGTPVLTFWHKIGVENYDHGYVDISEDGGITWTNLADFTNTWRSTWSHVQIPLSDYKTSPVKIRFRLRSNGSYQTWGWDIDDVEIKEMDPQELPFPLVSG